MSKCSAAIRASTTKPTCTGSTTTCTTRPTVNGKSVRGTAVRTECIEADRMICAEPVATEPVTNLPSCHLPWFLCSRFMFISQLRKFTVTPHISFIRTQTIRKMLSTDTSTVSRFDHAEPDINTHRVLDSNS
ncbi:hypothetical protein F443_21499 [Phytophthora nicotianae P1569]|uniref:Uncharacterized protein n=2 Tax=Phytophthora nicotianae TaxID=4792 RepID=V9DZ14_PHYNI|nr:hypothetical protein F443_21499 [Phytophthora nicotianae P1569]ETO59285.1 hypothetical protein F444_22344 [Phytophthora nicotianae P1976]